jgi:hypothetical protein
MVVNLTALIKEVIDTWRPKAEQKGLWLYFEKVPPLPELVRVDEDKLRRVLLNLLDNAVQSTKTGGVTLYVSQRGHEVELSQRSDSLSYLPPMVHLTITVQDTGPGVDQAGIEQLTTSWSRAKIKALRRSGARVGIPIAVKLVELMGGKLSMSSTLDKGTAVVVELVLEVPDPIDGGDEIPYAAAPLELGQAKPSFISSDSLAGMLILFFVSALFFVWPFLAAPSVQRPHVLFVYLFSAWAVVIAIIFLLNRGHPSAGFRRREKRQDS